MSQNVPQRFYQPASIGDVYSIVGGILVDDCYLSSDGTDDALSIARAIALAQTSGSNTVIFSSRTYTLKSPVEVSGGAPFRLVGQGYSRNVLEYGTWLLVEDPSFIPFQISNVSCFQLLNLGVSQTHSIEFAPGWAPVEYPVFFVFNDCENMVIEKVMGAPIYQMFSFYLCAHLTFRDVYGQFFSFCLQIDKSYDSTYFDHIHAWPFWAINDYVTAWQLQNCDVVYFLRADTPYLGTIFGYGARSVVRWGQSNTDGPSLPGGFATAGTYMNINGDTVEHAIWVDSTVQLTENVGENGLWGFIGTITCGCGVTPVGGFSRANAVPVLVDGVANLLISQLTSNVFPVAPVKINSATTPSQVTISRSLCEFSEADPGTRCFFILANATGSWPGDGTGLKNIGRILDANPGNAGIPVKNAGTTGTVYTVNQTAG